MPSSFKELRVWREALKFTVSPFIGRPATSPDTSFTELHSSYDVPRFRFPATLLKEKDHRSDREFRNFLSHATGSLLEVQTQLIIAQELQYISPEEGEQLLASSDGIGRCLNALINSISETARLRPAAND